MAIYRLLFPILIVTIPIFLLNCIGKNVNIINERNGAFNIYDANMNVTHTGIYTHEDVIEMTCNAINKYGGRYVRYSNIHSSGDSCFENSASYNTDILIMAVLVIIEMGIYCSVVSTYVFYYHSGRYYEPNQDNFSLNKFFLFMIIVFFQFSICMDITSLGYDSKILQFYGNDAYEISGTTYYLTDVNSRVYEMNITNSVSFLRSFCDGSNFYGRYFEKIYQLIELNTCKHVSYGIGIGGYMRAIVIFFSLCLLGRNYHVTRQYS